MKEKLKRFWDNPHIQSFIHTLITEIIWDEAIGKAAGAIIAATTGSTLWGILGYALFRTSTRVLRDELKKYYKKEEVIITEKV